MNKKITINNQNSLEEIASKSKSIKAGLKSKYIVCKFQREFFQTFDIPITPVRNEVLTQRGFALETLGVSDQYA